jgi:hypothetical protein
VLLLERRLRQVEHDALLGIVRLHGDAGAAGAPGGVAAIWMMR